MPGYLHQKTSHETKKQGDAEHEGIKTNPSESNQSQLRDTFVIISHLSTTAG